MGGYEQSLTSQDTYIEKRYRGGHGGKFLIESISPFRFGAIEAVVEVEVGRWHACAESRFARVSGMGGSQ